MPPRHLLDRSVLLLASLALVSACSGPVAPAPAGPAGTQAAPVTSSGQTPVAPVVPVAPAALTGNILSGQIQPTGASNAAFGVTVYALGDRNHALATATADASGAFQVKLPDTLAADTPLELIATRGKVSLVTLTTSSSARHVSDAVSSAIVISEATTLAYLTLAPRLEALGQMSASAQTQLSKTLALLMGRVFASLTVEAQTTLEAVTDVQRKAALSTAIDEAIANAPAGSLPSLDQSSMKNLLLLAPTLKVTILDQAQKLNDALATGTQQGGTIDPTLGAPIDLGNGTSVPGVNTPGSHSSGGGVAIPDDTLKGGLAIGTGELSETTASATLTTNQ